VNIKSFFNFDRKDGQISRISANDNFFTTLFEILEGRRAKFMGDLARNFGFYFRKLNLERTDDLVITLFAMVRNLKMQKSPDNIKSLIYARARINRLTEQYRNEEAQIFKTLFENCYRIVFQTNKREDIVKRARQLSRFFEEILLNIPVK
jgi:hypothetical protein